MSEKRFIYGYDVYWVKDNYKNVELLPIDVLILLNEQDKELDKYRTENAELHITILENEKEIDEQQATINKLQDTLFAKEKTIDRLENTIAHLNQSDNSLKKNKKITELANIIHNMKMVLSNDEKQITKIIKAYQDEIDKWKGRTLILLKEMEDE